MFIKAFSSFIHRTRQFSAHSVTRCIHNRLRLKRWAKTDLTVIKATANAFKILLFDATITNLLITTPHFQWNLNVYCISQIVYEDHHKNYN